MSRNIALVSWDSVRADHLSLFGYSRETTPYLNKMESDCLVFEKAFAPGVGTTSSFGGSFTGDYINATKSEKDPAFWRRVLSKQQYLAEVLQEEGYYTGAVHSNALLSDEYGWGRGFDEFNSSKWTKVDDDAAGNGRSGWGAFKKDTLLPLIQRLGIAGEVIHARNIILKTPAYTPWEDLWSDIKEFVENAPEPWFLFVLLVDTHHPWYAPPEYHEWSQPGFRRAHFLSYVMRYHHEWLGERRQSIVNAYDNELRHADAFLEAFDGLLEDTGNEDAALIVHSDHGDGLGEHGRYGHDSKMYDSVVHVPLLMRNVGEVGRVSTPVSNVALGDTILDIAGSDRQLGDRQSLLSDRNDQPVIAENFIDGGEMMAAAVDDTWKVLYQPDTGWEAYHRATDRFEQDNRWGEHPESMEEQVRDHMKRRLKYHPENSAAPEESGDDELKEIREQLTNLGYID